MSVVIPAAATPASRPLHDRDGLRHANAAELEAALTDGRQRTFSLFEGFERALGAGGLRIPIDPVLNLPLWELGHIGWFEEVWIARNPDRSLGDRADPSQRREPSVLPSADALWDSSNVPHARRWELELPSPSDTRAYLRQVRESTLHLLSRSPSTDADLYVFRLVLGHDDMHREAWHVMAQRLGIDLGRALQGRSPRVSDVAGEWTVPAGVHRLGSGPMGFAFDNEREARDRPFDRFTIDRAPVTWAQFVPFIESGAYGTPGHWSDEGWDWRSQLALWHPHHLRRAAPGRWERQCFGLWTVIDLAAPVVQVSAYEAEAWCRWAGRRLPTELEWEAAATRAEREGEAFDWGAVWEWTASPFAPYPGFVPHPYRDYSLPWFDGRPVLRGASFATTPRMVHPRYRNFYPAGRNDVFAGFRSCRA